MTARIVQPRAVLLTGTLGSGKTSVAVEIGARLDRAGLRNAVIDLDWLCWAGPDFSGEQIHRLLAVNLHAVSAKFIEAGVRHLVLCRALLHPDHLAAVRSGMAGVELFVVRLAVLAAVARARIASRDAGANLNTHLDEVDSFTAAVDGLGVEDAVVSNDGRPVAATAGAVLSLLGWLDAASE